MAAWLRIELTEDERRIVRAEMHSHPDASVRRRLWSFKRLFVRVASGRQRFNVLGASNAITRELLLVTNTTVVNTDTMCELLRRIAAQGLTGPEQRHAF